MREELDKVQGKIDELEAQATQEDVLRTHVQHPGAKRVQQSKAASATQVRGFGKSPSVQDKALEQVGPLGKVFGKKESLKASEPTDDSTIRSPARSE